MTVTSWKVGQVIAQALGSGPSRSNLALQRATVVAAMQDAATPRRVSARGLVVAFAAVGISLLALWTFAADGELSARFAGKELGESAEVQVQAEAAEAVDFSDGSRLSLEPKARIELAQLSPERASITLRQGRLAASIRKGTGRAWTISAGPYAVRVIGTEFSVDWDRNDQAFSVSVREGKVLVLGKDLPVSGIALDAGGHFERRATPPAGAQAGGTEHRAVVPNAQLSQQEKDAARPGSAPRSVESWDKLAGEAQYKRALELAEKAGFERLTLELPENDLLLLANTARYAGDSRRARGALFKLRERFPGRSAAPLGALYLARMAEDHDRDPSEAANWLSVFLNESPRGELAAGARARLLSILLKQGNKARARAVAADYLMYHPTGPHASQARSVVGSSSK